MEVDFPLRGEWVAFNTPAERVPSHGTNELGQRFAYDFLRIDGRARGWKFWAPPMWRYYTKGVSLGECPAWAAPIHSPFSGTVVSARDGWPERQRLHPVIDVVSVILKSLHFVPGRNLMSLLGNHVVLQMGESEVFALLAHARKGSIRVRDGDLVASGQHIADVGHSGNSTAPHLHFQLMDSHNLRKARGLPCRFARYETLSDGRWIEVQGGMPRKRELIRRE